MTGQPPPRARGRLVLVVMLLAAAILAAWLLLRARPPVETVPAPPAAQAEEQPIAVYLARGDAVRGEAFFRRCIACHSVEQGGPASVGPNLWGVMGGPIGQRPGYVFSADLSSRGGTWDWEAANLFLRDPRAFAPRTRMTFAGVRNPQDRADVMLWLNRQGGTLTAPAGAR
jgi:cytochrome c